MTETAGTAFTGLIIVWTVCPVCLGSSWLAVGERCPDCVDGLLAKETTG